MIPVKHPSVKEAYPEGTIVLWKKTGKRARIKQLFFLKDGVSFTHYMGTVEGRDNTKGLWALYHDDLELIQLP